MIIFVSSLENDTGSFRICIIILKYLFYVYECIPVHMCAHHIHAGAHGSQERLKGALEWELGSIMSHHVLLNSEPSFQPQNVYYNFIRE